MRTCYVCKKRKKLILFAKDKKAKYGHAYRCKSCNAKVCKAWSLNNLAKKQAADRAYGKEHRPQRTIYEKNHRLEHAEQVAATLSKYNVKNAAKIKKRRHKYYEANKAHIIKAVIEWTKAHPEQAKQNNIVRTQRHRAAKAQALINDLTAAQWQEIKAAYSFRCVYCDRKMTRLTQDHIIAVSKGGNHTASNIVPACHSCNSRKGDRAPLIPVQPLLFTLAPAKPYKPK